MTGRNTFVRPMTGWYLRNRRFRAYMLREGTALFVLAYALVLLAGLTALARGPEAYSGFRAMLVSPASLVFHALVAIAALYNSYTWFAVAPKAMPPLFFRGRPVSARLIIAAHYAGFAVATAAAIVLAAGG